MPLPASGQIDFGQIQTEFGGSNPIAMNEYGDKIGLTVNTTSAHNIAQFHGLSNVTLGSWPGSTTNFYRSHAFKSDTYEAFVRLDAQIVGTQVKLGYTLGGSSAMATTFYGYVNFSGSTPTMKVDWSISSQSGVRSSPTLTDNVYYSIPTSGVRQWTWKAGFATSGTNNISGTFTAYINNAAGTINSGSKSFTLSTTAGGGGGKN
tara:strand:+ start:649 stop:1263 length:615 start_codon:yes stop_codon:yes gene_type:complete